MMHALFYSLRNLALFKVVRREWILSKAEYHFVSDEEQSTKAWSNNAWVFLRMTVWKYKQLVTGVYLQLSNGYCILHTITFMPKI